MHRFIWDYEDINVRIAILARIHHSIYEGIRCAYIEVHMIGSEPQQEQKCTGTKQSKFSRYNRQPHLAAIANDAYNLFCFDSIYQIAYSGDRKL